MLGWRTMANKWTDEWTRRVAVEQAGAEGSRWPTGPRRGMALDGELLEAVRRTDVDDERIATAIYLSGAYEQRYAWHLSAPAEQCEAVRRALGQLLRAVEPAVEAQQVLLVLCRGVGDHARTRAPRGDHAGAVRQVLGQLGL